MAAKSAGAMFSTNLTYTKRLVLTACIFVFMMAMAGFANSISELAATPGTRAYLLLTAAFQNIIGFAGTAFVCAVFLSNKPMDMLGVNRTGTWLSVGGILLIYAVGQPFLNQVIWWNSQMHFPDSLSEVEQIMRNWEDSMANHTEVMLQGTSISTLLLNILVVGILTGICEELVFRGTFQRVIGSGPLGAHLSIWITAVIFSIMHFQFFGFLPRVLLGTFFGYIFYWTGSIWISATAHAINNSLYILVTWLIQRGVQITGFDTFGVTFKGFPAVACVSFCLVIFIFIVLRKYLFKTHG
ncbi:MAG: CPBP family intramembrane metalloprotease [Prevotella sp.]|nr:CPBP family intramembrane metalloprotease [Prevotella sp.]MCM1075513.1 CPBP family intramembrane metalloprotease [Ruminococcus sp.]